MLDSDSRFGYVSLFSGGGIGDAGIHWGSGVPLISACEYVSERADMLRHNYPEAKIFPRSIELEKENIEAHAHKILGGKNPWLVVLSPPCQGMSTNGAGKLWKKIQQNKSFPSDERNQLILPGIEVLQSLTPDWFILENVPNMKNTIIKNFVGEPENICEFIKNSLPDYTITQDSINFLDYGVPHNRSRLITIGVRNELYKSLDFNAKTEFFPPQTHGKHLSKKHVNLEDAIGSLPKLDAKTKLTDEKVPYHTVPKWNDEHYRWMDATPPGKSAFDNEECKNCGTSIYEMSDDEIGEISNADLDSAIDCPKCKSPLPRPQTTFLGWLCVKCNSKNRSSALKCGCGHNYRGKKMTTQRRLIRGFKTSYRRLSWKAPASTITMNSGTISSDMKGHPKQNRVLSVKEILILSTMHSIPGHHKYPWERYEFKTKNASGSKEVSLGTIRDVIGESIPPLATKLLVDHLKKIDSRISKLNL
jgi:DNA (cytosine-5)-methyltransferase 1